MTRVFYDEDVPGGALDGERVAILGYGIQGRAQALNLRDSGVEVIVGNRADPYRAQAEHDGFAVTDLAGAARQGSVVVVLLPDEAQPGIYAESIAPNLAPGNALVFAHGFTVHHGLIEPPDSVDLLLVAPRMPGKYLRQRFVDQWGVPAFVGVHNDATGRAWSRLLGLAGALGITRCAAIEASFAEETELDHFSEHFTYPLIFRALEDAFDLLVAAGYPPEVALMELHGSGELGEVLSAAAREGLTGMISSHASPACQVGIAHHWNSALGPAADVEDRIKQVLDNIRSGHFARHLVAQEANGYPELKTWQSNRSSALERAESSLRTWLRGPTRRE
ncbi:MAG: ketol-acid reductoisomerase [Proteobacteria bacterium]|nr:ketol-acid reductoisomerase [Pseudomonadota bacterium]